MSDSPATQATAANAPTMSNMKKFEIGTALAIATLILSTCVAQNVKISKNTDVERIISTQIEIQKMQGLLEPCSAVIGTLRREGMCGSFGDYTVLTGGREMYVFRGPNHNPTVVGAANKIGLFVANDELKQAALDK